MLEKGFSCQARTPCSFDRCAVTRVLPPASRVCVRRLLCGCCFARLRRHVMIQQGAHDNQGGAGEGQLHQQLDRLS